MSHPETDADGYAEFVAAAYVRLRYGRLAAEGAARMAELLREGVIRVVAGLGVFERGRAYYRDGRVLEVDRDGPRLVGKVLGRATCKVRVWSERTQLLHSCTCPFAREAFCKHAVALSLAWLAREKRQSGIHDELRSALESLEPSVLVDALVGIASMNAEVRNRVEAVVGLGNGDLPVTITEARVEPFPARTRA